MKRFKVHVNCGSPLICGGGASIFKVALFGGARGLYSLHYTTISATHMIHIIMVIDVYIKLQWAKTK